MTATPSNCLTPKDFDIKNPEFKFRNNDCMALELELKIGPDKGKSSRTVLTFRTNQISGYDMQVMFHSRYDPKADAFLWEGPYQTGAISIEFDGGYEQEVLIAAFQKIGLLTLPIYGKIERGPFEPEEESNDAVREQPPPV